MKSVKINRRALISQECFLDLLDNMLEVEDILSASQSPRVSYLIAYSDVFETSLHANLSVLEDRIELHSVYATHDGVDFGVSNSFVCAFEQRISEIHEFSLLRNAEFVEFDF